MQGRGRVWPIARSCVVCVSSFAAVLEGTRSKNKESKEDTQGQSSKLSERRRREVKSQGRDENERARGEG